MVYRTPHRSVSGRYWILSDRAEGVAFTWDTCIQRFHIWRLDVIIWRMTSSTWRLIWRLTWRLLVNFKSTYLFFLEGVGRYPAGFGRFSETSFFSEIFIKKYSKLKKLSRFEFFKFELSRGQKFGSKIWMSLSTVQLRWAAFPSPGVSVSASVVDRDEGFIATC